MAKSKIDSELERLSSSQSPEIMSISFENLKCYLMSKIISISHFLQTNDKCKLQINRFSSFSQQTHVIHMKCSDSFSSIDSICIKSHAFVVQCMRKKLKFLKNFPSCIFIKTQNKGRSENIKISPCMQFGVVEQKFFFHVLISLMHT